MHLVSEDDEIFAKDDEEILEKMTKKLSFILKVLIWAKKSLTD